jgi:urocanate hydratase
MAENHIDFKYPSYVQDIMGPMCFDFGFGPFVGAGKPEDLKTDAIACAVLEEMAKQHLLKFSNKCR